MQHLDLPQSESFRIDDPPIGPHEVYVTAEGYAAWREAVELSVPGEQVLLVPLEGGASIAGQITDASTGEPLAQVVVLSETDVAATTLLVAMKVINCLKVCLAPFLPFSSQKVHEYLGLRGTIEEATWDYETLVNEIKPGQTLQSPAPLYTKLDPQVVEDETQRLGGQVA